MVVDVKPVAHVQAVAVERDFLAFDQIRDEQRNDFFGELIRPEIIRAACDARVQSEGLVIRTHDQIARRFAGSIRAVGANQ